MEVIDQRNTRTVRADTLKRGDTFEIPGRFYMVTEESGSFGDTEAVCLGPTNAGLSQEIEDRVLVYPVELALTIQSGGALK